MKRVVILASALLVWVNGPAASADPPAGALAEPEVETRLLEQIKSEIGAAVCSSDAQCRTLPVGAKACGGPAAWWPWSVASADGQRLRAWAQELDRLQRLRLEASGMRSNCQYVPDPGAACIAQRCTLRIRSNATVLSAAPHAGGWEQD